MPMGHFRVFVPAGLSAPTPWVVILSTPVPTLPPRAAARAARAARSGDTSLILPVACSEHLASAHLIVIASPMATSAFSASVAIAPRLSGGRDSRRAAAVPAEKRRAFVVPFASRSPAVAFVDVVDDVADDAGIVLKPFQDGMQKVSMFGVSHMTNNFEAAEHILRTKPRSVVVETALCKQHGAQRGTVLNFAEIFASIHVGGMSGADEALQFITRVAHQLRLEEHPLEKSPFWAQMKTQLPAEALVYAATFAVDARLVFGDRPKETTYRRLVSCPTLSELDQTFGNQSTRNYRLLLPEDHPEAAIPPPKEDDMFEKVCISERDTILAHTIREEAAADGKSGEVVAVVGADHLPGVEKEWEAMVSSGGATVGEEAMAELLRAPETVSDDIGVRLAIMQRLLGLRCTESLVADANAALDADLAALEGDDIIAFNASSEIYGSARMLLACCEDRKVFDAVVSGVEKSDFQKELQPMTDVRPSKGGAGWSEDALVWLRTAAAVDLTVLQGA